MPYINGKKQAKPIRTPHILNVHEQRYNARFYESVAAIMSLRATYLRDKYIFVQGEAMIPILTGLGAHPDDFSLVQEISDLTGPDPTLDYRSVTYGRYHFDPETRSIRRLTSQPYTLTVQEDYKRHDSGIPRTFDEAPTAMQGNTVVQALMLFKALVFHNIPVPPREKLNYANPSWICTMFNARTHTHRSAGLFGEPALEGVHSDGSDHTMTVFLGASNMSSDSAVTFMHDNAEITGIRTEETNPILIKGRVQHQKFLDTLMFVDHAFKHSVTSVRQVDDKRPATRDMLVVFTRKEREEGHVSGLTDSLELHAGEPLCMPMWLP